MNIQAHQKRAVALARTFQGDSGSGYLEEVDALLTHCAARRGADVLFMGIDPGTQGALAIMAVSSSNPEHIAPRAAVGFDKLDEHQIFKLVGRAARLVRSYEGQVMCEDVWPRPHDSARGAFTFGANFAWIKAALLVSGARARFVSPNKWQRDLGLLGKGKDGKKELLMTRAQAMWPDWHMTKGGKRSIADAMLLAHYCASRYATMLLEDPSLGF